MKYSPLGTIDKMLVTMIASKFSLGILPFTEHHPSPTNVFASHFQHIVELKVASRITNSKF